MLAIVNSKEYDDHETGAHPENKERTHVIMDSLEKSGVLNHFESDILDKSNGSVDVFSPEHASDSSILKVHSRSYVEYLKSFCNSGGGYLDFDTVVSEKSYNVAKLAAGGSIMASKLVLNGYDSAYSIARPPGHHARKENAMGFCLFNNVAIAIENLKESTELKKFLIFDFDVHFGNGTSEIFRKDPNVMYISIHQDPKTIFPGTGFIEDIGEDDGKGFNMNIPMPPRSTSSDYKFILDELLNPVAKDFDADFYFLEVGFDAHEDDPLSSINLDDEFFPWITSKMLNITDKMVLILEGGYDLSVLSRCNMKMINILRNTNDYDENNYDKQDHEMKVSEETRKILKNIKDIFSSFYEF
jgi:acetoin utilization deacetylase AcuC-like enzyme